MKRYEYPALLRRAEVPMPSLVTMATRQARTRQVGPSVGRLLVLLVALAGLFAMHGLSDHGMPDHQAADHVMAPTMAVEMTPTPSLRGSETATFADSGNAGMAMLGMCVAVLLAFRLLLPRARGRLQSRQWSVLRRVRPLLLAAAREPKPPDLRALSVYRC